MSTHKAKILWHEIWFDGPLVGVCEYSNEKMIYVKNSEGKYDIRRFIEGGLEKALTHHLSYRARCGGTRDHDPQYYSLSSTRDPNEVVSITNSFDYYSVAVQDIVDTLSKEEFAWYYPPRRIVTNVVGRENFVPNEGKDLC